MAMKSPFSAAVLAGVFLAGLVTQTASAQSLLGASKRSGKKQAAASKSTASTVKKSAPAKPAKATASRKPAARPTPAAQRPNALLATVLEGVAVQAALDQAGYSPGIIDGVTGRKTEAAIRAFQAFASLQQTGKMDEPTRKALQIDTRETVRSYLITESDAALVAPPPKTWPQKSKATLLGYPSLVSLVAERGHCTTALLARLNAGVKLDALKVGQSINIPNVETAPTQAAAKAAVVEIDLGSKIIRALDESGKVMSLYHCSIAADRRKRPTEKCVIDNVVENPKYTFDPVNWPEVKDVKQKLLIPAGPRNPVGLCWIGLSKKGYGIHGTPEPENIGKTGSHGCFRLTNWDALRLARQVRIGAGVRFTETPAEVAIAESPTKRR